MTPFLTARGRQVLLLAGVFLVIGTLMTLPPVIMLAGLIAATVGAAYLRAIMRLWDLESERFSVRLGFEATADATTWLRGSRVPLKLVYRNRSRFSIPNVTFELAAPSGIEVDTPNIATGFVHKGTRSTVTVEAKAARTGRWVLHGAWVSADDLLGFVRATVFKPLSLPVHILPTPGVASRRGLRLRRRSVMRTLAGMHPMPQPGEGYQLRELREYQPGDLFRNIAWKASAKGGKLTVRQMEDEVTLKNEIILDISPTMRGGDGREKFEQALTLVQDLASRVIEDGDHIGLITCDERVEHTIKPAGGPAQQRRIIDLLVALNTVTDEALTEYDDEEVTAALVEYLMVQQRLDFRAGKRKGRPGEMVNNTFDHEFNADLLDRWIRGRIEQEAAAANIDLPGPAFGLKRSQLFRIFATIRGVEIPYRVAARVGMKELSLVEALEAADKQTREKQVIVMITDLCSMIQYDATSMTIQALVTAGNRVICFVPYTPEYVSAQGEGKQKKLEEMLIELYAVAERRERRTALAALQGAGCDIIPIGPGDNLATIMAAIG